MNRSYTLPLLLAILTLMWGTRSVAQESPEWRVFSALDRSNDVAPTNSRGVLVGTDGGAYLVDQEGEVSEVWRSNGELLELRVTALAEDPGTGDIYFGSGDGSVSILRHQGWWTYIGDLARSGKASREITGFAFHGDQVFILSSFGVSLFNLEDSTLRDSWTRLGPIQADTRVNDLVVANDSVFVATEAGLAIAPLSGRDLADPLSWRGLAMEEPCGPEVVSLAHDGSIIFVAGSSGVCRYREGSLESIPGAPGSLTFAEWGSSGLFGASGDRIYRITNAGDFEQITSVGTPVTGLAALDDNRLVAGMERGGAVLVENEEKRPILPDGPVSNYFADLVVDNLGNLWVASGSEGVSRLSGLQWDNFRQGTTPGLTSNSVRNVSLDHTGRIWGGSYGDGFFRFEESGEDVTVDHFDETNTPLQDISSEPGFTVAENVISDEQGVVWVLNWDNTDGRRNALYSYRYADGEGNGSWTPHPLSNQFWSYNKTFRWIAIDYNGTKWIGGADRAQGLLFYVDDGDPAIPGEWGSLTQTNGLPSNLQTSLLVDRDGELWVGTPNGVAILVNPYSVRQDGPSAAVFRDVPALENVYVWDIAADALNRKWVASDRGVFLLSSDGTELLDRFTTENSPLTEDEVLSVATDDRNGFVYFGTGNGLNRVETPAVESPDSELITVHPQPFRAGVDRELRFEGLPEAATIKVLTIDGRLVVEFPSPGGAVAYWDGLDEDGLPVATGVYLVVAESREGGSVAGKIAIIRP